MLQMHAARKHDESGERDVLVGIWIGTGADGDVCERLAKWRQKQEDDRADGEKWTHTHGSVLSVGGLFNCRGGQRVATWNCGDFDPGIFCESDILAVDKPSF